MATGALLARSPRLSDAAFIPPWVNVSVAIALGLGTRVGGKRIVVTVGEKIQVVLIYARLLQMVQKFLK